MGVDGQLNEMEVSGAIPLMDREGYLELLDAKAHEIQRLEGYNASLMRALKAEERKKTAVRRQLLESVRARKQGSSAVWAVLLAIAVTATAVSGIFVHTDSLKDLGKFLGAESTTSVEHNPSSRY